MKLKSYRNRNTQYVWKDLENVDFSKQRKKRDYQYSLLMAGGILIFSMIVLSAVLIAR